MKTPLSHLRENSVVERVRTNSILNPLLWLSGIIIVPSIPAVCATDDGVRLFFCFLTALPILSSVLAYFIWVVKDPDRLQSEDYQLAQKRILHATKEEDEFATIDQARDRSSTAIAAVSFESDQPDEPPSNASSVLYDATKKRS
ncbi:hypothetical protein [Acidisphaera rubrifaciens]|uniref:hypothetical protein n=1 Tax=Acidisphaera rubrifaciens TaxID=50715 RepID=UPI0011DD4CBB|nr:hypothetical protein [Acidisphaera rubrifaciens]